MILPDNVAAILPILRLLARQVNEDQEQADELFERTLRAAIDDPQHVKSDEELEIWLTGLLETEISGSANTGAPKIRGMCDLLFREHFTPETASQGVIRWQPSDAWFRMG